MQRMRRLMGTQRVKDASTHKWAHKESKMHPQPSTHIPQTVIPSSSDLGYYRRDFQTKLRGIGDRSQSSHPLNNQGKKQRKSIIDRRERKLSHVHWKNRRQRISFDHPHTEKEPQLLDRQWLIEVPRIFFFKWLIVIKFAESLAVEYLYLHVLNSRDQCPTWSIVWSVGHWLVCWSICHDITF